jgi:hypothetical protein
MADYYTLLTNAGIAYETACKAAGVPIKLAQISVGDGNGAVYNPDASAKALKREVWRGPLNALFQDEKNANWLMAEVTIPSNVGGWYVREAGLWTDSGILYAIVKYPESYKPVLTTSGAGKEFYIRSIFETTNAANVTLLIDDTVVKATRAWVMDYLAQQLAKGTYTKAEIEALVTKASALPVGSITAFPLNKIPSGFLEIDGSVKSVAAYPDLAAFLGSAFNKGDEGAGNFRLPETRGEFLRGWDHGRGADAGRTLGSYQLDQMQGHFHSPPVNSLHFFGSPPGIGNALSSAGTGVVGFLSTGGAITDGVNGVPRTGSETRSRNFSVIWCIKAWNAPINQGNIEVSALMPLAAQATESNQGTAKVATQAQLNAGVDDATIVTPKKMRAGFSVSLGATGYIAFPSWLGGVIVQWFKGPISANETDVYPAISFPMAFPSACLIPSVTTLGNNTVLSDQIFQVGTWNKETIKLFPQWFGTGNQGLTYPLVIAIGY